MAGKRICYSISVFGQENLMEQVTENFDNAREFSLTKSAGIVGISKFVNLLGLLCVSIVLTRVLSRTNYGNYEQVWLIYNSFLPLVAYGLSSGVYFFSAREDKRRIYSSAILLVSIIGFLMGIFLILFAPAIAFLFGSSSLSGYIRIFAIYAVVSSPSLLFESVFVSEKRVGMLLSGNIIVSILFAATTSISAIVFHSLAFVFWSLVVVGAVKSIFLLYFLYKERKFNLQKTLDAMKAQLAYAAPIFISSVIATISKQIDRYLVTLFFSADQFAIYAIGSKEIPFITVITGSASAVLFPAFSEFSSKEMHEKFVATWRNSISKTGLFLLPMMVFLFFTAKDLMFFFFGEKYVVSSTIFRIFLLLLPLRLAFYSTALLMLGKQKLYMYTTIFELVLSALASYFLMSKYGLEGAAVGKVAITYIEVAFLITVLVTVLRTNLKELFPWLKLLKIFFVSVISILPAMFARNLFGDIYVRFLLETTLFVAVFCVIAISIKLVRVVSLKEFRFVVN
jgi:O-antigen/teichoic acid export membrane protein